MRNIPEYWNIEVTSLEQFREIANFLFRNEDHRKWFWESVDNDYIQIFENCFIRKDKSGFGFGYSQVRSSHYDKSDSITWDEFIELRALDVKAKEEAALFDIEEFKHIQYRMSEEGFDYCFDGYSSWGDVKNQEFHKLRIDYLKAKKALESFINNKIGEEE